MPAIYTLSRTADSDLRQIARYTFETWGEQQALKYTQSLLDCFQRLADSPLLGRPSDDVSQGLRRIEQGRHVVFYRELSAGVRIIRILHCSALPDRHRFPE
jgi:toxin ParE1/3/4